MIGIDPTHVTQYNWQLIEETKPGYRLNMGGDIRDGPFISVYYDNRREGIQSGYFKSTGRWYAIDKIGSSEPLMVTWLKGSRVFFKGPIRDGCDESYIKIVRKYNSENISVPFCIEI